MKYKKLLVSYDKNKKNIEIGHVVRVRVKNRSWLNGIVGVVFDVHENSISLKDKNGENHILYTEWLRRVHITDADIFLYHTHGLKLLLEEIEKREKKKIKKMLKTRKKNAAKREEQ